MSNDRDSEWFDEFRDSEWFDEFWGYLDSDIDEDGGTSAVRLLAEMYDAGIVDRDGDYLVGEMDDIATRVHLTTDDQYLVRRIFDAVDQTNRPKL